MAPPCRAVVTVPPSPTAAASSFATGDEVAHPTHAQSARRFGSGETTPTSRSVPAGGPGRHHGDLPCARHDALAADHAHVRDHARGGAVPESKIIARASAPSGSHLRAPGIAPDHLVEQSPATPTPVLLPDTPSRTLLPAHTMMMCDLIGSGPPIGSSSSRSILVYTGMVRSRCPSPGTGWPGVFGAPSDAISGAASTSQHRRPSHALQRARVSPS